MLVMVSALLNSLVNCPAPAGPISLTVSLNVANTGRAASKASRDPPVKVVRVRARAPGLPPLTGASR
jgi:hypothetical protein